MSTASHLLIVDSLNNQHPIVACLVQSVLKALFFQETPRALSSLTSWAPILLLVQAALINLLIESLSFSQTSLVWRSRTAKLLQMGLQRGCNVMFGFRITSKVDLLFHSPITLTEPSDTGRPWIPANAMVIPEPERAGERSSIWTWIKFIFLVALPNIPAMFHSSPAKVDQRTISVWCRNNKLCYLLMVNYISVYQFD